MRTHFPSIKRDKSPCAAASRRSYSSGVTGPESISSTDERSGRGARASFTAFSAMPGDSLSSRRKNLTVPVFTFFALTFLSGPISTIKQRPSVRQFTSVWTWVPGLRIFSHSENSSLRSWGNGTWVCPKSHASKGMLSNSCLVIRKYCPSLSMVWPYKAPWATPMR